MITNAFDALAKSEKEAFGAPDHPVLVVQHPIGTVKIEEVNKKADAAFSKLMEILLAPEAARTKVAVTDSFRGFAVTSVQNAEFFSVAISEVTFEKSLPLAAGEVERRIPL